MMLRKLLLLFLFFSGCNLLSGQPKKFPDYISPVQLPVSFSGGFGELRRNHFHSGLDFRTNGQTGYPVMAVREGTAVRVSVSPFGYGNALYLQHPDGKTSVYGHLSRFHPRIEQYVKEQQYELRQFAVDLTLTPGKIAFKKGEIIAWSGNSGSSGGPHLHFEIRDTQSEKPQNPLFYLPGITDRSAPRITSLYLYPLSDNSSVNKGRNKTRMEISGSSKKPTLRSKLPVEVFGEIGVGITADDDFNGSGLRCGIYAAELWLDQSLVYSFRFDQLAFDQSRYLNSHIDYEELIRNNRWIHRLYLQPGNRMDISLPGPNRGILVIQDGKVHDLKIMVSDAFKNYSILTFKVISKKISLPVRNQSFTKLFTYDKRNEFEAEHVKLELQEGTLYETLKFDYHLADKRADLYSDVHRIHNSSVPVHKPYTLSIQTRNLPSSLQYKALMVTLTPSGRLSPVGGEYSDGWITAHPRVFGDFGIAVDNTPPKILPVSIQDHQLLKDKSKITFRISDDLSGIASFEGKIDGEWVLFEFDARTETLTYQVDRARIKAGINHRLDLTVADERRNTSEYHATFNL